MSCGSRNCCKPQCCQQGPQGPQGPPGFGATGPTGFGATGPTGFGATGPTGFGATGPTGFGATGPTGFGATGPTGFGATGPVGPAGTQMSMLHFSTGTPFLYEPRPPILPTVVFPISLTVFDSDALAGSDIVFIGHGGSGIITPPLISPLTFHDLPQYQFNMSQDATLTTLSVTVHDLTSTSTVVQAILRVEVLTALPNSDSFSFTGFSVDVIGGPPAVTATVSQNPTPLPVTTGTQVLLVAYPPSSLQPIGAEVSTSGIGAGISYSTP